MYLEPGQCMIMPVGKGPGQVGKVVVPASCNGNILYLEYISVYERRFFFNFESDLMVCRNS